MAYSSVAYDLHSKRRVYERLGVREYVAVVIMENRIEWFVSKEGRFVDLEADEHRVYRSTVFPKLWFAADSLLKGDVAGVLEGLGRGLADAEHAVFVECATFDPSSESQKRQRFSGSPRRLSIWLPSLMGRRLE